MFSRILIVEDDTAIAQQAQTILEEAGHAVVEHGRVDVVLASITVGFERIAQLSKVAPVLVLTAWAAPELIAKAREHGAVGHVVKPFDCDELRERVAELAPAELQLAA